MKNVLIGVLLGIILGGAGGFAAGIFVFPYLFPPPPVNEVVPEAHSKRVVARGEFIHANPSDPVHYGKGKLTLYEDLVHLEADFEVGPGPKFHVYLVPTLDTSSGRRSPTPFLLALALVAPLFAAVGASSQEAVRLSAGDSIRVDGQIVWGLTYRILTDFLARI